MSLKRSGGLLVQPRRTPDAGRTLTYALTPDIQLDSGVRAGLTRAAGDFGAFVGLSVRF